MTTSTTRKTTRDGVAVVKRPDIFPRHLRSKETATGELNRLRAEASFRASRGLSPVNPSPSLEGYSGSSMKPLYEPISIVHRDRVERWTGPTTRAVRPWKGSVSRAYVENTRRLFRRSGVLKSPYFVKRSKPWRGV